jgi:predicted DNA binding protein
MSFIAEFAVDIRVLETVAERTPAMELRTEELLPSSPPKFLCWASGASFAEFEAALAADETVDGFRELTETGDRRLYSVTFSQAGSSRLVYPGAAENDIEFLDVLTTEGVAHVRARVPSREALKAFRRVCRDRDVGFDLESLYAATVDDPVGAPYGLTEAQYVALELAFEAGYFESPRAASSRELAADLDISRQAFQSRLRRGTAQLLAAALFDDTM